MSGFEIKQCRSCSAPVIWTVTHNGKRMPVDAKPVDAKPGGDGNIRLRAEADGRTVIAEYPGHESQMLWETRDHRRYVSHWATCPAAGKHRRGA